MQAPSTSTPFKPTLKKGSRPYIFHIQSKSRPDVFHVADAYRMTCTCEAGRARRLCWHLRLAIRCYDWWKSQQVTGPSAPARAATPKPILAAAPSAPASGPPATARPLETGLRALQSAFE